MDETKYYIGFVIAKNHNNQFKSRRGQQVISSFR